jgi:hypothetical protein
MGKNTKLLFLLFSLLTIVSCDEKSDPSTDNNSSQNCIDQYGPAFYLNSSDQCEWAPALTIPTSGGYWATNTVYSSQLQDAYILIHRENGAIIGWGKCYGRNTAYNGWMIGSSTTDPSYSVGTFQWDLAPGNVRTLLISNQFNCTITQISNISSNAAAYPTSCTMTVTSAVGSKSFTFNLVSGAGPF